MSSTYLARAIRQADELKIEKQIVNVLTSRRADKNLLIV
jgi:hypothetical protein